MSPYGIRIPIILSLSTTSSTMTHERVAKHAASQSGAAQLVPVARTNAERFPDVFRVSSLKRSRPVVKYQRVWGVWCLPMVYEFLSFSRIPI